MKEKFCAKNEKNFHKQKWKFIDINSVKMMNQINFAEKKQSKKFIFEFSFA